MKKIFIALIWSLVFPLVLHASVDDPGIGAGEVAHLTRRAEGEISS
ncbi:MAG: hypothetical protein LBQ90_09915 [Synergistaceae bacterium]|nr:hypothetical protein [Synergistaceae bacterium]